MSSTGLTRRRRKGQRKRPEGLEQVLRATAQFLQTAWEIRCFDPGGSVVHVKRDQWNFLKRELGDILEEVQRLQTEVDEDGDDETKDALAVVHQVRR